VLKDTIESGNGLWVDKQADQERLSQGSPNEGFGILGIVSSSNVGLSSGLNNSCVGDPGRRSNSRGDVLCISLNGGRELGRATARLRSTKYRSLSRNRQESFA
jgi:hypothetical protein